MNVGGCGQVEGRFGVVHNILKLVCVEPKKLNLMLEVKMPYQKVSRTFVFEKEETMQAEIVDLQIDWGPDPIDLGPIFAIHCPLAASRITLYDPATNTFLPLRRLGAQNGFFAHRLLEPQVILVRYRPREAKTEGSDDSASEFQVDSADRKDMRSRERSVAEAIDLVKRWRGLHLNCAKPNNSRKKVNLQEAARMLGVSKKSLDDYYCQLRLAEQYGFDFEANLNQKMGILRSFVKEAKLEEERQKLRPHRHPKNLKIIEDFQLDSRLQSHLQSREPSVRSDSLPRRAASEPLNPNPNPNPNPNYNPSLIPNPPESIQNNPQEMMEINNLEHQFFRGFEFLLDDPNDPFLAMNNDFSKQGLDDESFLFF